MAPPKEATGRAGRKRVSRRGETGAERPPHKCPREHLREVFVRKVQSVREHSLHFALGFPAGV